MSFLKMADASSPLVGNKYLEKHLRDWEASCDDRTSTTTGSKKIEETNHTEVQFQTVDDILEYYGKRHKGLHDSKESVN